MGGACRLGLVPNNASDPSWRYGVADWSQDAGALSFTVLGAVAVEARKGDLSDVVLAVRIHASPKNAWTVALSAQIRAFFGVWGRSAEAIEDVAGDLLDIAIAFGQAETTGLTVEWAA